jgi:hypothetical protein
MDDYFAKLFAGHMGISAVLANVLVDKGVISIDELSDRFRQAHRAAALCSSGPATAHALAEIIAYLDRQSAKRARPSAVSRWAPRSSAGARLLEAIDRRIEAFLTGPSAPNQRQVRGRLAGSRVLPAHRWLRHHPLRPLPGPRREARGGQSSQRASLLPESLRARLQATRVPNASQPSIAWREPTAGTRVALRRNGVQHPRELPSSP